MKVLHVGVDATVGMHKIGKNTCVHNLHQQVGPDGKIKEGKCSRICKYGYIICTVNYKMEGRLYGINGG